MNLRWAKIMVYSILIMVVIGVFIKELKASIVSPETRFNLVYIDEGGKRVSVVTIDPVEEKVMIITYPEKLAITSRSVGEYEIGSLYKLGSYKSRGGEFARRKVQGFMRLPIVGYLVNLDGSDNTLDSLKKSMMKAIWSHKLENNLTTIDAYRLTQAIGSYSTKNVAEEELIRAGLIVRDEDEKLSYNAPALSNYVGKSFFDWGVGREGVTVSIINESGESGLGSDMAEFLDNMGLDVITVKSGSVISDTTRTVVKDPDASRATLTFMSRVFNFKPYELGDTAEYRAGIVMWVGKDALELF
ncbi:MAG: LytR family transcriptional regulator [Candidatus Moraniibacteriota bacterium]|nr:MAG: LytR family transcriptional regulator [Candidatus Moranbacteria bacterium]